MRAGWKYIHGDVFRFPPYLNLFCAVVGTGTQVGGCAGGRAGVPRLRRAPGGGGPCQRLPLSAS